MSNLAAQITKQQQTTFAVSMFANLARGTGDNME
jgi:hypothetical protein